jgi:hypothetical protein
VAVLVALLPVSAFLLVLVLSDSFKLVSRGMLIRALIAVRAAAVVAALINHQLLAAGLRRPHRSAATSRPSSRSVLKAIFVLSTPCVSARSDSWWTRQLSVLPSGTGFALVENIEYLSVLGAPALWLWVARGFGTAILHASTTALVAIAAKSWAERAAGGTAVAFCRPCGRHRSALRLQPLAGASTAGGHLLMLVMPSIVLFVFGRSERATREWVGDGLDLDVELLNLVTSSYFGSTTSGALSERAEERAFPGPIVADMFCLLQLDLELSIRAKGMLLAREQGLEIPMDDSIRARLDERALSAQIHWSYGLAGAAPAASHQRSRRLAAVSAQTTIGPMARSLTAADHETYPDALGRDIGNSLRSKLSLHKPQHLERIRRCGGRQTSAGGRRLKTR